MNYSSKGSQFSTRSRIKKKLMEGVSSIGAYKQLEVKLEFFVFPEQSRKVFPFVLAY